MTGHRTEPVAESSPSDINLLLSRASLLQFAALALEPPSADVRAELHDLLPSLAEDQQRVATEILAVPLHDWEPEFFSVLGPAGLAAVESSYERAAQASRGPLLMEVAGFYSAFGYAPVRLKEVPDHVAIELGFLSFLAMKQAFAAFEARSDDFQITADAFKRFHECHVNVWTPEFFEALRATGSPLFAQISELATLALGDGGGPLQTREEHQ